MYESLKRLKDRNENMYSIETLVNHIYFCDIMFLLLLEDVGQLVFMKWVIRKSKEKTRMPAHHYRTVLPEVMRTMQKTSFYRVCSQLLHIKNEIEHHDPFKWGIGFSNGIFKYRSCTMTLADLVLLKVIKMFSSSCNVGSFIVSSDPSGMSAAGLLLKSRSIHLCRRRKAKASWRLMGFHI